jgi:hypothetical protein
LQGFAPLFTIIFMAHQLTNDQQQIYDKLKVSIGDELDLWLSIPNKSFRNRPPLELLLTNDFGYFGQFITPNEV